MINPDTEAVNERKFKKKVEGMIFMTIRKGTTTPMTTSTKPIPTSILGDKALIVARLVCKASKPPGGWALLQNRADPEHYKDRP